MRKIGFSVVLLVLAVSVPALFSQENYKVVNGPEKSYYGHISLVEILNDGKDPVVLRPGANEPLPAVLNFPLGPGDTIRTSDARRLEIQFDNATIVRLDKATELKIETILARSLSRRETSMTNLVLAKGRIYVMYKEYDRGEIFQVLTPNAAVKLRHNSVATIAALPDSSADIQVAFGKATAMFGPDEKNLFEAEAGRNERLVIDAAGKAMTGVPSPEPEFAAWNVSINKSFEALHEGKSNLPKPLIRGVTKATFYFAQTFGDKYGEWLYDNLYGYVWRPFYNDYYPGGSWSPYYYGQWVGMGSQMFWIPSEPWGWVPYHLGVWQWDAKRGWFWLPGSAFAPAWVDWAYMNGMYYAWRPWIDVRLDLFRRHLGDEPEHVRLLRRVLDGLRRVVRLLLRRVGELLGWGWRSVSRLCRRLSGAAHAAVRVQGPAQEAVGLSGPFDAQRIQPDRQSHRGRPEARRRPADGSARRRRPADSPRRKPCRQSAAPSRPFEPGRDAPRGRGPADLPGAQSVDGSCHSARDPLRRLESGYPTRHPSRSEHPLLERNQRGRLPRAQAVLGDDGPRRSCRAGFGPVVRRFDERRSERRLDEHGRLELLGLVLGFGVLRDVLERRSHPLIHRPGEPERRVEKNIVS